MSKKLLLNLLCSSCWISAYADEQAIQMKQQALKQIESVYATEQRYMTFSGTEDKVKIPEYIKTTLSTNWDFVIFNIINQQKESSLTPAIVIDRVEIVINGMAVARSVNLTLKPKINNKYYFEDLKLNDYIRKIANGYTVFGGFDSVGASQFLGYSDYRLKPLQVVYSWHYLFSNKTNISKVDLFILMGQK